MIRYIKALKSPEEEYPNSYWANTSSNSIVHRLIEMADNSVKSELEELIEDGTVEKLIHEDITRFFYGSLHIPTLS